jgi:hypothetical protein
MKAKAIRLFLRRLADTPIPDERKSRRLGCQIPCYLFTLKGEAFAGTILDKSASGVRVRCDNPQGHNATAYVLRMDTGAAYTVRLAWWVGSLAGYNFGRRVDFRLRQDIALKALRAAWKDQATTTEQV